MASSNPFSISTNGSVLDGFDSEQVAVEFSKMFGVSADKAAEFVNNKKLVKKGLSQKQVNLFESKLTSIGVAVTIDGPASNDDNFSLVEETPPSPAPAIPSASETPVQSASETPVRSAAAETPATTATPAPSK